jgi:hypothetical protein
VSDNKHQEEPKTQVPPPPPRQPDQDLKGYIERGNKVATTEPREDKSP